MGVSHVAVQFPLYEKAKSWAGKCSAISDLHVNEADSLQWIKAIIDL